MDALARVLDGRAAPVAAFEHSVTNTKYGECCPLPSPVYSCATLTTLDLHSWRLRVPSRLTGLRAVRSLRLSDVVATDADLRRLISRCGALEHLEIYNLQSAERRLRLVLSYCYPEHSWSINDTMDSEEDYSFSEIQEMCDYKNMAEMEHSQTDEIGNMMTFLGGLRAAKKLRLYLPTEYSQVLSKAKVWMPKRLPKKNYLLGLETLTLTLDHNHEVAATFISCLLNSSPNLKNLIIEEPWRMGNPESLPAEFWEEQVDADCALNHLSSVTFYIDSLFKGHPCSGLCLFLVTKARVLKRMCIEYHRSEVRPEDAARVEAPRSELQLWPRASPDVVLEQSPLDCNPCYRGPWYPTHGWLI
ncbi:hypothetical protein BAE44_0023227 [Dichanthelium oligosanthes]|uniref:F-box/LRR-repeat protein 15/At3g58940/PEG3-like LRR domain-containing protein n=1 Tax=Dichanthelium oligosanthes TaxID=888268 RepID=A0A1E5US98_9POAL|nr:hypothetical protein BAE44_0023227 [Dichanthelium oligosanthes]